MQAALSSRAMQALATTTTHILSAKGPSLARAPRATRSAISLRSPHLVVRAASIEATVRANPSTLTLAAFAATHLSSQAAAAVSLNSLYAALAYWTLGAAAVSLLTRKHTHDRHEREGLQATQGALCLRLETQTEAHLSPCRISCLVGPAWLALAFCGGFGYVSDAQAVVFLFGTVLADDLDGKVRKRISCMSWRSRAPAAAPPRHPLTLLRELLLPFLPQKLLFSGKEVLPPARRFSRERL